MKRGEAAAQYCAAKAAPSSTAPEEPSSIAPHKRRSRESGAQEKSGVQEKAAFKRIKSGAQKKSGVQEKKQRSRGAKPSLKREWKRRGRSPLPRERARKKITRPGHTCGGG